MNEANSPVEAGIRQMCSSCPFNPNSRTFWMMAGWVDHCDTEMKQDGLPMDGSVTHGCHNLGDLPETTDENLKCIGHLNWLRGKGSGNA